LGGLDFNWPTLQGGRDRFRHKAADGFAYYRRWRRHEVAKL
jgi:hypothetical protein